MNPDSQNKFEPWRYAEAREYLERVRSGFPPVIICIACNGGIQGKESNAALPETAEEIALDVQRAYEAGASMVHVHARSEHKIWRGATKPEEWFKVNRAIRELCPEIIINNSTGGDLEMSMEERLSCLDAGPEVASLNLVPEMSRFTLKARPESMRDPRPEHQLDVCVPYTYGLVRLFAEKMGKRRIKPELETYHTGGAWVMKDLIEAGLVTAPYWVQTVMGAQTGSLPTVDNVVQLLREIPSNSVWLCSAIGPHQLPMTTLALLLGGHVRVGMEDNVYFRRGERALSNAAFVERTCRIARELNRGIATPAEARRMLALSPVPSKY